MSGTTDVLLDPVIALSTFTNRFERKSANSFRNSAYGPGGLYTVAKARDNMDFFLTSKSVTFSTSTSNELNL